MKLTEPELHELQRAARMTWEYIGDDIFQGDMDAEISRADVIELVLDADRLETVNPSLSPRIKEYLKSASYTALRNDILPAFPHRTYGY